MKNPSLVFFANLLLFSFYLHSMNPPAGGQYNAETERSEPIIPRIAPPPDPPTEGYISQVFTCLHQDLACSGAENIMHELDKRNGRFAHEETEYYRSRNRTRCQYAVQDAIKQKNPLLLKQLLETFYRYKIETSDQQMSTAEDFFNKSEIQLFEMIVEGLMEQINIINQGRDFARKMIKGKERHLQIYNVNPCLGTLFKALKQTLVQQVSHLKEPIMKGGDPRFQAALAHPQLQVCLNQSVPRPIVPPATSATSTDNGSPTGSLHAPPNSSSNSISSLPDTGASTGSDSY